jgi:Insertion element 4 transposase N-terminal/Transposase DDE domain
VTVPRDVLDDSGGRLTDSVGLGVLTRVIPRDVVDEVLNSTGKIEQRKRLLPARVVVYYVLALTLFYGDAYEEVLQKLVNGLRFLRSWRSEWTVPTTGAISRARDRLGVQPLRELFARVAQPIAVTGTPGAWYRQWRVMAIDGVVLDVPDTPENLERFEKSEHRDCASACPQVRVVGLVECGTHAMVAAALDSWRIYERALLERLLRQFQPDMLVLADRGFFSYEVWKQAADTGAAQLWRVASNLRLPILTQLSDGSYLSELLPRQLKTDLNRGMKRRVPMRSGSRCASSNTASPTATRSSLSDCSPLSPTTSSILRLSWPHVCRMYAERWEFEIGLDEIETHQIAGARLLRSKKPDLVEQEIWALLLTHYAIRHLMGEWP